MTWSLSDVVEEQEKKMSVELVTFNLLDLYGEFIKANHTKEQFETFAEKWCEEHAAELS